MLGQTYIARTNKAALGALADLLASGKPVLVSVTGVLNSAGATRAESLAIHAIDYVPGASTVMVAGRLTSVDSSTGKARIGGVQFDYTSLLANQDVSLKLGTVMAIAGTQASARSGCTGDRHAVTA